MKRIISLLIIAIALNANAFDLKSLLSGASKSDTTSTSSTSSKLGALGSMLGGLIASDNLSTSDLVGTWKYDSPAVSFKSDNFLQKAGGAAAAVAVENKLEPYYSKIGFTALVLTVEVDSTFTMKFKRATLSGSITKEGDNFIFNVKIGNKISLGKMTAYITKTGTSIDMTFDVTKLVAIMQKVASISGNTTISTISELLNSYDGICAGYTLNKTE